MRRLMIVGLLIGCTMTAAPIGASAQSEPSNELLGGQVVAVPEAGISIEFPPGWRVEPARSESRPPLTALSQVNNLRAQQTCTIALFEGLNPSEAVDIGSFDQIAEIEVLERSELTLPVGDAERVFWRYRDLDPSYDYYVAVPAGAVIVGCFGDDPPTDRWLSIVESIEVLADDGAPSPTFDPRVVVPDHGFAIDFPVEWTVRASAKTTGLMFGGDSVLWASRDDPLAEPAETSECWLDDNTGVPGASDLSLDVWLEVIGDAASTSPLAVEPVSTHVDLPSGPSGYVEWTWDGYSPRTAWVFVEGERRLLLSCMVDDPPEDRWLSIVETFEFLPAEE